MSTNFKIKMLGRAGVITCDLTGKEIARGVKMMPELAKITDKKDNELFRISVGIEESFTKYGVTFAVVEENENKPATVTFQTSKCEMTKEEIVDELGVTLIYLDRILGAIKANVGAVESALDKYFEEEAEAPVVIEPVAEDYTQMTLEETN